MTDLYNDSNENKTNINNENIEYLKNEILNLSSNKSFENELSEERKILLDDFFEKTCHIVIFELLIKIREHLLSEKAKNKSNDCFKISSPAIIFPNKFYSSKDLEYLENKYYEKIASERLDDIGIVSVKLERTKTILKNSIFNIDYTELRDCNNVIGNRCNNSYVLSATYDIKKNLHAKVKNFV